MARQGILSNSAGPTAAAPSKDRFEQGAAKSKKKRNEKKKSKRDRQVASSGESDSVLVADLDREQDTIHQESDGADEMQEDLAISSQQKRINAIMDEDDLSSDDGAIEADPITEKSKSSNPQKRIQDNMDEYEGKLLLKKEDQENNNALHNGATTAAAKKVANEKNLKSFIPPESPAAVPVKKRARVIMDSDSD